LQKYHLQKFAKRQRIRLTFPPPADYPEGVMGLSYASLNALGTLPVFDVLVNKMDVGNLFSMCFTQFGGMMTLGGIGPYHNSSIMYTPVVEEYFYGIKMLDLRVNGKSIGVSSNIYNRKFCIVDSGTVMPTIPVPAFEALRASFLELCLSSPLVGVCVGAISPNQTLFDGVCYNLTASQIAQFPTLQFVLPAASNDTTTEILLEYTPQQYLQTQYYCNSPESVGFGVDQDSDFTVIGAELMMGYHTIFDRANKRIGFAQVANCPSNQR